MSVNTGLVFENNTEGTQKKTVICLGWFTPSDFDLAGILKNAAEQMDPEYQWDTAKLPIYGWCMSRAYFDEMVEAYNAIISLPYGSQMQYRKRFTLDKKTTKL